MVAAEYRRALLATFETSHETCAETRDATYGEDFARDPDIEWASSGAMALTGFADGPPLLAPGPLASAARAAVDAIASIARKLSFARCRELESMDGPALLGERAAIAKLRRQGTTAPGGSCHLMPCADGWIAVNLARPEDLELVPAWLDEPLACVSLAPRDAVAAIRSVVRSREVAPLAERAQLLGLPVAEAGRRVTPPATAVRVALRGRRRALAIERPPLVVDLSSLWAGPLSAHLLSLAGARVIKVESTRRPDGARRGPSDFFDLLNAGKESVALDFASPEGRRALERLIASADIVIESSRPRALAALGIDAETMVASHSGVVWVSITGYGRREPESERVAFGDDASAAAGLAMALAGPAGTPVFCGDAIADPLAGLHAALAALAAWRAGDGVLIDVALCDVAAFAAGFSMPSRNARVIERPGQSAMNRDERAFEVAVGDERVAVAPPRARSVASGAARLGEHNEKVLGELRLDRC
jgi:crotonobetainyl-CoA:carnitine CoA-transferase CaiB-like acyl-CoA transferase